MLKLLTLLSDGLYKCLLQYSVIVCCSSMNLFHLSTLALRLGLFHYLTSESTITLEYISTVSSIMTGFTISMARVLPWSVRIHIVLSLLMRIVVP